MQTYHNPMRVCDAADFDGTDYMTRGAGLTGAADAKTGIFAGWVRLDGSNGSLLIILALTTTVAGATSHLNVGRLGGGSNIFFVSGFNAAGSFILDLPGASAFTAAATWRHILASWDLANNVGHFYINDVSDAGTTAFTDDSIDYTTADCSIGATADGTNDFDGCLGEIYFAPGQYLDLSLVANRRKFISASGKPVHLGTTGALPTGTAPLVYLHLDDAEAVANFATNRGTGGDFSITGTLATGSSSPSG
jgi:hypothetical protein